jgi:hypothetical protein
MAYYYQSDDGLEMIDITASCVSCQVKVTYRTDVVDMTPGVVVVGTMDALNLGSLFRASLLV